MERAVLRGRPRPGRRGPRAARGRRRPRRAHEGRPRGGRDRRRVGARDAEGGHRTLLEEEVALGRRPRRGEEAVLGDKVGAAMKDRHAVILNGPRSMQSGDP